MGLSHRALGNTDVSCHVVKHVLCEAQGTTHSVQKYVSGHNELTLIMFNHLQKIPLQRQNTHLRYLVKRFPCQSKITNNFQQLETLKSAY